MPHLFDHESLTQLVQLIGYPGLFAVVFLESGVFFGFFFPGSSLLFTAGLLAGSGIFNPWILIPLMALAAILGDNAGYWFGAKIGEPFVQKSRWFRREHLQRAHEFYDRHGVQAIFLARFVPVVRTFAPMVAGIVAMKYRTFLFYNILGGILWAAGVTFAGYFLGKRVPFINEYISQIMIAIIIVSFIPIVIEMYKSHRKNRISL